MRILCFFAIVFLLYNCTPNSITYERILKNDSSYDIWVIDPNPTSTCNLSTERFQDSILIPSNTQYILEALSEDNGSVDTYSDCPFLCFDNLNSSISNHDSLSLTASLAPSNNNWEYSVIHPGSSGSCECKLTITDADIN